MMLDLTNTLINIPDFNAAEALLVDTVVIRY